LSIFLRHLDENHVGQLGLRMVGDADTDVVVLAFDLFVTLGVKQIVGNVHD
jgi:hypothetical protein